MIDAFIYDGIRTPFGRHAGALAAVRPDEGPASVVLFDATRPPRIRRC